MARVILCETKVATTSYIFPNTKIEVFSYEELCYYVYNNIALLSEEYIGKKLFDWIEKELEMEELALKLRVVKDKDSTDLTDLLTTILTHKEFYTIPEIKEFIVQIERIKGLSAPQFRKKQADGFLRYRKYVKAASIYDEILEQYSDMNNDKLLGAIYHNRAVALANNFELEEAMSSYKKAFELTENKESLYQYMLLLATVKDQAEVQEMAKLHGVEEFVLKIYDAIDDVQTDVKGSPLYRRMEKAIFHYQKNNLTDFNNRMDAVIEELKTEIREQVV